MDNKVTNGASNEQNSCENISHMVQNNTADDQKQQGCTKRNFESVRIPPAFVFQNNLNLHSVEDSFSEMSKIDSFKKISIPFLVHQTNTEKRGFCKERKCSQST